MSLSLSSGNVAAAEFSNVFLAGDLNGDNVVNSLDYAIFIGKFGSNDSLADFNGDGEVNTLDYGILLRNYDVSGEE